METTKNKRGRPEVQIEWPNGEFTAEQAYSLNQASVSKVSVHNKINKAVKDGGLERTKKTPNKIGRPSYMYAVKENMNARLSDEEEQQPNF